MFKLLLLVLSLIAPLAYATDPAESLTEEQEQSIANLPEVKGMTLCNTVLPNDETVCEFVRRLKKEHPDKDFTEDLNACKKCEAEAASKNKPR